MFPYVPPPSTLRSSSDLSLEHLQGYQDFPFTSCHVPCIASLVTNIPQQKGSSLGWCTHFGTSLSLSVDGLRDVATHSKGLENCLRISIQHFSSIWSSCTNMKILCVLLFIPLSMDSTDLINPLQILNFSRSYQWNHTIATWIELAYFSFSIFKKAIMGWQDGSMGKSA